MGRYVARRILLMIPTVLAVLVFVFVVFRVVPGDVVRLIAGEYATESQIQALRAQLGLADPIPVQFARYLAGIARGDLGKSLIYGRPVAREILVRLPATIELAVAGIGVSLLVGLVAGVVSAVKRNSWYDYISRLLSVAGVCIPNFWIALVLIALFSVRLGWLPTAGRSGLTSLVLPTISLSSRLTAIIARLTRSTMLEAMRQDYVRTARAKGLGEYATICRHAMKNALIPVTTVVGLQFGALLGGSIVVETVFSWPGIGLLLVQAVSSRDYPMIQGITVVYAACFILINLVTDMVYSYLDPRVRYE